MAKPSLRCIVSLRYTPATGPSSTRRAVGGFLRYVQYRDHHERESGIKAVAGMLRYVAWRDAATPQGRLFTADGKAGDAERKRLGAYIARSVAGLPLSSEGRPPHRACYRLVISPEDARGLDLRAIARAGLAQLEQDAGGKVGPWIAAEHRNTDHPHVHVVLAARREVEPGRYRTVLISRRRLERMKAAVGREIARQRGVRVRARAGQRRSLERQLQPRAADRAVLRRLSQSRSQVARGLHLLGRMAGKAARRYVREAERIARARERALDLELAR